MEYVINDAYGGFYIPDEIWDNVWRNQHPGEDVRRNPILINWVKEHYGKTELAITVIPEYATDWELTEYDGLEEIIAVIDGRIVHLETEKYDKEEEDW